MSEPTYNVEITFHGAYNLPVADLPTLSADPYIHATLSIPAWDDHSHGKDSDPMHPPVTFRTPTVRRTRNAEWCPSDHGDHTAACSQSSGASGDGNGLCIAAGKWLVGGVPASGFALHMRLRDEDPGNRDDRLGRARASFPDNAGGGPGTLKEGWEELRAKYAVKKRHGSPRTYLQTSVAAMLPGVKLNKHAYVELSVRVVGKTEGNETKGRVFTLGPTRWSQHFSPLIGAVAPARAARPTDKEKESAAADQSQGKGLPFNPRGGNADTNLCSSVFISNKLQLTGPVPAELRNEFVGYRPFINWMFKSQGIRGMVLNRALKKQYRTIYSYDKNTRYGVITAGDGAEDHQPEESDSGHAGEEVALQTKGAKAAGEALALQFLRMTSFGVGGRMFTYVITLDGEWRWTETGVEFAVDLLSKHTMHADVSRVIAWSGEFFVRRLVDKPGGGFESAIKIEDGTIGQDDDEKKGEEKRGEADEEEVADAEADEEDMQEDPALYELVIDNDSGTYRPPKDKLPVLRKWLADNAHLGALGRVTCVDGFDPGLERAKKARTEARKRGRGVQDDKKKDEGVANGEGKKGPVARAKQAADGVESKVMAAVGKDESHAKGKGGDAGRMAVPRKSSSLSSIGSGILGAGRRGSVSSDEVKDALAKAEEQAAGGSQGGPSRET